MYLVYKSEQSYSQTISARCWCLHLQSASDTMLESCIRSHSFETTLQQQTHTTGWFLL